MADENISNNHGPKWMRIVARILATLWCAFWVFFGIASGIGEGGASLVGHLIFPTLIFILLFLVFWRWEKVGSIIMIIISLFVAIAYPLTFGRRFPAITTIMMELTMALPPLIAGVLSILYRRKTKGVPVAPIGA